MSVTSAHHLEKVAIEYQAGGIVYRRADLTDDSALKQILHETSMDAWVRLSQEHEPSYFALVDLFGQRKAIIATKRDVTGVLVGMCSSVDMPVHINGKAVMAGYLGELRVLPAFRNKLRIVQSGFASVRQINDPLQQLQYWFTSIANENQAARRLLEANLKGMPNYQPQGEMVTYALSTRLAKHNAGLQRAEVNDIPAIVQFYNQFASQYQYSPVLTEAWLRGLDDRNGLRLSDFYLLKQDDQIQACFALWDQRRLKQTVVRGYRFPLSILRVPYNLFAKLTKRVVLPATGEQVDYIFIAFLATTGLGNDDLDALLRGALALIKNRHARLGMLGISPMNPLLAVLANYPTQIYHTLIEQVSWPDRPSPGLDGRTVQPEIAVL